MTFGIGAKSAIAFSTLVLLSTALVGVMVYAGSREFLIQASQEHLAHDNEVITMRLRDVVAGIGGTVQRLADRAVAPSPPLLTGRGTGRPGSRVKGQTSGRAWPASSTCSSSLSRTTTG
jgi:hypothetical protein